MTITTKCSPFLLRAMVSRSIRPTMLRSLLQQSTKRSSLLCPTSTITRFFSLSNNTKVVNLTEQERLFQSQGLLDEQGLLKFDTLHEMQTRACKVFAENKLFGTYSPESKQFKWMTFTEYGSAVERCRAVLKDLGVKEFTKVGIISNNRWEWPTIAAAVYSLNANLVPMYEAQLPRDWIYILNDSEAEVLFCATQDIYDRVQRDVLHSTPFVKESLCLDAPEGEPYAFSTAMAIHAPDTDGTMIRAPSPDDLANLMYTSGTTGKPKGVELTHLNFTSNIKSAALSMVDNPREFIRPDDCSLAFLPWAHSYGQTCELWNGVSHGVGMGICRGIPQILDDFSLVKPTMLFAVPTLYNRIYDGVHNMMENANPIRKRLMKAALKMGRLKVKADQGLRAPLSQTEMLEFRILDSLVLSKIRARFGGQLRHSFVGGAACPSEVANFMDAIGIPICEGYGLTETSPIIAMNSLNDRQLGTVGRPIGGVHVYILDKAGREVPHGEEGEICCVGPNIMRGYHKKPEETDKVLTVAPDGKSRMFRTGDLGRVNEKGVLKVTGRIKEQYKLENGKYIAPTPIEEAIGLSRFVHQVVICGANRPYNVALIVPEWSMIRTRLEIDENVSEDVLGNDRRVKALIDREISERCKKLKKFEIPQQWAFVAPFTAANEMLTPKMSIRRHQVIRAYGELIGHLYGDDSVDTDDLDFKEEVEHAEEHQAVA